MKREIFNSTKILCYEILYHGWLMFFNTSLRFARYELKKRKSFVFGRACDYNEEENSVFIIWIETGGFCLLKAFLIHWLTGCISHVII